MFLAFLSELQGQYVDIFRDIFIYISLNGFIIASSQSLLSFKEIMSSECFLQEPREWNLLRIKRIL